MRRGNPEALDRHGHAENACPRDDGTWIFTFPHQTNVPRYPDGQQKQDWLIFNLSIPQFKGFAMKLFLKSISILAAIVACTASNAQPETQAISLNSQTFAVNQSVDDLFKNLDLKKMNHPKTVVNLIAQLADPDASTTKVSDFTDFDVISVIHPDEETMVTEFNGDQKVLHQQKYDTPWIGVAPYTQKEIPNITLQEGFNRLQSCMAAKGQASPEAMTRVIIYKTIFGGQMIYDYVTKMPNMPEDLCQEALFDTTNNDCEWGMAVNCHFDVNDPFVLHHRTKK